MKKVISKQLKQKSELDQYVRALGLVAKVKVNRRYKSLVIEEYPFDEQLLSLCPIYRKSRKLYLKLGGQYKARVCSGMRALSTQDLFANMIEYSPLMTELMWFKDFYVEVFDTKEALASYNNSSSISLFHEQNHRILWKLLPPAPLNPSAFYRYLNFSESLVVILDLVLGDELGSKNSVAFELIKSTYRTGGEDSWCLKKSQVYREYLKALFASTYMLLELKDPRDIPAALKYLFPRNASMAKAAFKRSLDLSEMFVMNTNPEWQKKNWKIAQKKLSKLQAFRKENILILPDDPLDIRFSFEVLDLVFDAYQI